MPQVTEPVSPKPGFQRGSLCSQGLIPLDALDLPRGCRLFQSKSSAGMQPPTGRKSRRTMTSLRPGLGWWEPGSPAFAPNPQLLPKGKEGSHQPCPLGQGAEQFAEALPSSREGRVTRWGGPTGHTYTQTCKKRDSSLTRKLGQVEKKWKNKIKQLQKSLTSTDALLETTTCGLCYSKQAFQLCT